MPYSTRCGRGGHSSSCAPSSWFTRSRSTVHSQSNQNATAAQAKCPDPDVSARSGEKQTAGAPRALRRDNCLLADPRAPDTLLRQPALHLRVAQPPRLSGEAGSQLPVCQGRHPVDPAQHVPALADRDYFGYHVRDAGHRRRHGPRPAVYRARGGTRGVDSHDGVHAPLHGLRRHHGVPHGRPPAVALPAVVWLARRVRCTDGPALREAPDLALGQAQHRRAAARQRHPACRDMHDSHRHRERGSRDVKRRGHLGIPLRTPRVQQDGRQRYPALMVNVRCCATD
eukprot:7260854-Prymnesium_polylepis.1